jgi:hypothetical protein
MPVTSHAVSRWRPALAACAIAILAGLAAPPGHAAVLSDTIGVYSEELDRANSADPATVAQAQHDAAIGLVRQPFAWSRIETAPGRLDFSVYDTVMVAAAGAGLAVLPVLVDPPAWRTTAPASGALRGMYPPSDPAAMGVLAAALVRRYGPGGGFWAAHPELPPAPIRSWQIWNEPNVRAFWATGPDPEAYVRLLGAVATAIRAADPGAEIVAAGLPQPDNGLTIADFIDRMYAAGAGGMFDTLAIHPYASSAAGVLELLRQVRLQLDGLGDPDRPIWATEFGWATGGPPVTVTTSESAHAALLRDTITLMQRARAALHLRGAVVFRWRDVAPNPGQLDIWPLHTGLLRLDGSAKPALDALRDAAGVWRQEPTPAQSLSLTGLAQLIKSSAKGRPPAVAGVSRRTLRIRRFISHGRLVVLVDVPPGGGNRRVRISYASVRNGRAIVRAARTVGTRRRVARAVFRLTRHARASTSLRITASQGTARSTRMLRMR